MEENKTDIFNYISRKTVQSHIWIRGLMDDYCVEMSKLTGKSVMEINKRVLDKSNDHRLIMKDELEKMGFNE